MEKQEAIKKAYGDKWEVVRDFVDMTDGSLSVDHWIEYGLKIPFERIGFSERVPKSLIGILNNNGWIKIESEADLPKEDCDCMLYFKDGDMYCDRFLVNHRNFVKHHFRHISHYQPIQKPQPPIY